MSEHLNAAQQAEIKRQVDALVSKAIEQMALRKWAVEAAMKTNFTAPMTLAGDIYKFVTTANQ